MSAVDTKELHIDPEIAGLLARLNAVFPALGTEVLDAVEARRRFDELKRPPESVTPVGHVAELVVRGHEGAPLDARLYRPHVLTDAPLRTLVFFHGGGWVLGDLESHDELCRQLTVFLGVTVVSVAYRRAPEHPFPVSALDAQAAFADLASRADELRLAKPMAVGGDSAGGNLAAALCLDAAARGIEVAGQLLMYPVLDARCGTDSYVANAHGFYITRDHLQWFWDQYAGATDRLEPQASPMLAESLAGVAPAVVLTPGLDPLRDEGVAYAGRLRLAEVPVRLVDVPGAFHGFLGFTRELDLARRTLVELAAGVAATFAWSDESDD